MKNWLHLSAEGLAAPSDEWPCLLWRAAGDCERMRLAEAAQRLAGQPVDLLLPMEMCSFLRTEPWPSKRRPDAQAIAFAIEEQLGDDLEGVHVCAGRRDRQGRYPVLVTHKARFRALLHLLAALDKAAPPIKIDDLAFTSGFNSLSAFYSAFRQHTGQSPKAYVKQISLRARAQDSQ